PRCRLVRDVRGDDGHDLVPGTDVPAARDVLVRRGAAAEAVRLTRADRRGESRLAVVDMSDGADVDVRLGAREDFPGHELPRKSASLEGDPAACGEQHARSPAGMLVRADTPPATEVHPTPWGA